MQIVQRHFSTIGPKPYLSTDFQHVEFLFFLSCLSLEPFKKGTEGQK